MRRLMNPHCQATLFFAFGLSLKQNNGQPVRFRDAKTEAVQDANPVHYGFTCPPEIRSDGQGSVIVT